MSQFSDESLMPFGKYEGQRLIDVPARYLLWLYESENGIIHKQLREYVNENIDVIRHQAEKETFNTR